MGRTALVQFLGGGESLGSDFGQVFRRHLGTWMTSGTVKEVTHDVEMLFVRHDLQRRGFACEVFENVAAGLIVVRFTGPRGDWLDVTLKPGEMDEDWTAALPGTTLP